MQEPIQKVSKFYNSYKKNFDAKLNGNHFNLRIFIK